MDYDAINAAAINPNPYQGLKLRLAIMCCTNPSRNQPKPLSGIETAVSTALLAGNWVAINLNPYQGLKLNLECRFWQS